MNDYELIDTSAFAHRPPKQNPSEGFRVGERLIPQIAVKLKAYADMEFVAEWKGKHKKEIEGTE